ncbi:MAG: hypothetical protein J5706_03255, partial [Elusimicrobiales bacterium]|nr:hypothetical protein [Elusimicrobiales bacterium]
MAAAATDNIANLVKFILCSLKYGLFPCKYIIKLLRIIFKCRGQRNKSETSEIARFACNAVLKNGNFTVYGNYWNEAGRRNSG